MNRSVTDTRRRGVQYVEARLAQGDSSQDQREGERGECGHTPSEHQDQCSRARRNGD